MITKMLYIYIYIYIYMYFDYKLFSHDFFNFTNCNCINPQDGYKCNAHGEKGGKEGFYFIQFGTCITFFGL